MLTRAWSGEQQPSVCPMGGGHSRDPCVPLVRMLPLLRLCKGGCERGGVGAHCQSAVPTTVPSSNYPEVAWAEQDGSGQQLLKGVQWEDFPGQV